MNYYFAPMEGVTGYVYRNAHHAIFPGIDKYFTPFVSPNQNRCFTPREKRDILPENNSRMYVVPQILTNRFWISRGKPELRMSVGNRCF